MKYTNLIEHWKKKVLEKMYLFIFCGLINTLGGGRQPKKYTGAEGGFAPETP